MSAIYPECPTWTPIPAPLRRAGGGLTPVEHFIAALDGYTPSDNELEDLCAALHLVVSKKPLAVWMGYSFSDMGDTVSDAIVCAAEDEQSEEDDDEIQGCSACAGTGDGRYEGTRCGTCHGRGETPSPREIQRHEQEIAA